MGQIAQRIRDRKPLEDKHYLIALDIVNFLKENAGEAGLFDSKGNAGLRRKILKCLQHCEKVHLKDYLHRGNSIELAAALKSYIRTLKTPLIPSRVQKLVMAENENVPAETIASDALGLLMQELSGPRLTLVISLLELVFRVMQNSPRSELSSLVLPVMLLPTFFDFKSGGAPVWQKWKRLASVFYELLAQTHKRLPPTVSTRTQEQYRATLPPVV